MLKTDIAEKPCVTSTSLAKELNLQARQIRSYAAIAREFSPVVIDDPVKGYTPEGVAEIKRGVEFGGPTAYKRVLEQECAAAKADARADVEADGQQAYDSVFGAEHSGAIAQPTDSVTSMSSAPNPQPSAPQQLSDGSGRLTVLSGGQGDVLNPGVSTLVLTMPGDVAIAPPSSVGDGVKVPSGRPSFADTMGLTTVRQGQVTTRTELHQLRNGVHQVGQLAKQRLGQLVEESDQADAEFQKEEAALRQELTELKAMAGLIEEGAIQEGVREQHRQNRLGKLSRQFVEVAGGLGVGVQRSPVAAQSSPQSPSAPSQHSQG